MARRGVVGGQLGRGIRTARLLKQFGNLANQAFGIEQSHWGMRTERFVWVAAALVLLCRDNSESKSAVPRLVDFFPVDNKGGAQ